MSRLLVPLAALLCCPPISAGPADVIDVRVVCRDLCDFDVTLRHADSGWEHYADRWEVIGPGGELLGSRTLYHPHVDEQPFTRSLNGVRIPPEIRQVTVRGRDSVHGFGGLEKTVVLPPGR